MNYYICLVHKNNSEYSMKFKPSKHYLSNTLITFTLFLFFSSCKKNIPDITLDVGTIITRSVNVQTNQYKLNGSVDLASGVIVIEGNDITVDFQDALIQGSNDQEFPNKYYGLGILVKGGKNITLKNLKVRGFKIGLLAIDVENLIIDNADLSHNFRQQLKSTREKENEEDWMSYHHNENDEWFRYGAAVYLKNCNNAIVKNLKVTQGQNGLMLVNCHHGIFYNNNLSYNSGLGIGMYRSSNNKIMHNRCDWNIRGYSHGIYNRGQDSAGILAYESCHNNIFAYNSATHSGDGFFLWAGQEFMDTGKGGCNDNLIFKNDFSHSSNNAIEVTFSSNKIIENKLEDSDYGVWGGYSYDTDIWRNTFKGNNHSIAVEHGHNFYISNNTFSDEKIGLKFFERKKQPESWGFVKNRMISSMNHKIYNNNFISIKQPLQISQSTNIDIGYNYFLEFEKLLLEKMPNSYFTFSDNVIFQKNNLGNANRFFKTNNRENNVIKIAHDIQMIQEDTLPEINISPLPDGQHALLPTEHLRGRKYIIVNEWGPYNFEYPLIWLREKKEDQYTFAIFGPEGNWKLTGGKGFIKSSQQTGNTSTTLVLIKDKNFQESPSIKLEFIGSEFKDQFGKTNERGKPYAFNFTEKKQ